MRNLIELQAIEFGGAKDKSGAAAVAELRGKIPPQILGHYDRLVARGKKGLAPVRNQVCTGCHMRLPMAVIMSLMRGEDIQLCDSCGRYLHLVEGESPLPEPPAPPAKPAKSAKPAAAKGRKRKTTKQGA
jgi:hypothetical protein